jgi:hypothetical protein
MYCWKCQSKIDLPERKVGFHAQCEKCGYDLHVCKNCKYYYPGKPNDCSHPDTLFVSDKEKNNFCEDFSPLEKKVETKASSRETSQRLFGEDLSPKKKGFSSLFGEEE